MKLYAVFLRNHGRDPVHDMALVKEGFSWPAFLFTFVWAAWHRMWWLAMGLFTVMILSGAAVYHLGGAPNSEGAVSLILSLVIGCVGNDLRRWYLRQNDFSEVAVVAAKNSTDAEQRFLGTAEVAADGIYPRTAR